MPKVILILEIILLIVGIISMGFAGALYVPMDGQNNQIPSNGSSTVNITPIAYASNAGLGQLNYTLDLLNNTLLKGIHNSIGNVHFPEGIAYDPLNGNLYVTSHNTNSVSAINASTKKVIGSANVGKYPIELTYDSLNGNVYVTNFGSNNVSVISGTTNQAIGVIAVGTYPIGIAFDPLNNNLYVANSGSNNVSVINGTTNKVIGKTQVGSSPFGIAFDPLNNNLYVANSDSNNVSVINGTTNKATWSLNVGTHPEGVAFDSSNGHLYVTNFYSMNVSIINATTNKTMGYIAVGSHPQGLAVDSSNWYLFVTNCGSNNVSVINTSTNKAFVAVNVGVSPYWDTFDSSNGNVYVSNVCVDNVSIINGNTQKGIGDIPVGYLPGGVTFDQFNGNLYVVDPIKNIVFVINDYTNTVIQSIQVGLYPKAVAVDSSNGNLYVANEHSNNVSIIDGTTNNIIGNLTVGRSPQGVAFDPLNGYVYVTNWGSNNVSVINGTTNKVIGKIQVGSSPFSIAFDPSNNNLYVANCGSGDVSVINGTTNKLFENITVGCCPESIAMDSLNGNLYVLNSGSCSVSVINGITDKLYGNISVGYTPDTVAIDPLNGYVYVTNFGSNNVSVINGTINKSIGYITVGENPDGVASDPLNGNVYIDNYCSGTISIISTAQNYETTFNESGLPSGASWSLNLSNGFSSGAITGSSYSLSLVYGTYYYTIATTDKPYLSTPSSGSINLKGTAESYSVKFYLVYPVTISESGLPSGTAWYLNLSTTGQTFMSTSSTISFSEPNGTYSYTIGTTDKIYESSAGSIPVNGTSVSKSIIFSIVKYTVTFTETGLPSGTSWYVNLTNVLNSGTITGTSHSFSLINGTYSYTIGTTDKTYESSSRSLTVNGTSVSRIVSFSVVNYTVTFTETGLPSGTPWYLNLSTTGQTFMTTSSTISFFEPNGTYSYTISTTDKTYHANAGSLTVNGANISQQIGFSRFTYTVTLTESGLPSGTPWYANISTTGQSFSSTSSTISFSETNGTYSYTIGTTDKIYESSAGSIPVNGTSVSKSIIFSIVKYTVTFTESGLPSGTPWYVNITGQSSSGALTGLSYTVNLINGTYTYTISTTDKIYESPSRSLTVNGTSTSRNVSFSVVNYTVTFTETGLPSGTSWYVNLSNRMNSAAMTGKSYNVFLTNGTYSYSVSATDKIYHANSGSITVNGKNTLQFINFTKFTYAVTFTESGLSNGTHWNITFNGVNSSSNGTTITFDIVNGTYSYTVSNVSGYSITNGSESFSVNGANVAKNIKFTLSPSSGLSTMELIGISAVVAIIAAVGVILYIRKK
jgi:YVTN family beta-propeller protein